MTDGSEETVSTVVEGRVRAWIGTYLTGLAMGSADAVPGVSGGTIALIAGIYDRLVGAIASFEPAALVEAVGERDYRPLLDLLVEMDVRFLVVLGLGVLSGVATVARALEFALHDFRALTFGFFLGLIGASAFVLFDQVALDRRREQGAALAGGVFAFLLAGEGLRATLGHGPAVVFVAGVVAISAMILPGVSGSFLLLMFGQLEFMTESLNEFVDALAGLATGGALQDLVRPGIPVVAFCTGAGIGILSFARVVEYALERDREATLTFLVALMVGALRLPVREIVEHGSATVGGVATVAVTALVGAGLVVALDRYTAGIGYETDD